MTADYPEGRPREVVIRRSDEPEVVFHSDDIDVSRSSKIDWKGGTSSDEFQVCIELSENQQRMLSEIAGSDVTELRISVDDLADLASVIAN